MSEDLFPGTAGIPESLWLAALQAESRRQDRLAGSKAAQLVGCLGPQALRAETDSLTRMLLQGGRSTEALALARSAFDDTFAPTAAESAIAERIRRTRFGSVPDLRRLVTGRGVTLWWGRDFVPGDSDGETIVRFADGDGEVLPADIAVVKLPAAQPPRSVVGFRLLLAEDPGQWFDYLRDHHRPEAQELVGDLSLIRPTRDPLFSEDASIAGFASPLIAMCVLLRAIGKRTVARVIGDGDGLAPLEPEEHEWLTRHYAPAADGIPTWTA